MSPVSKKKTSPVSTSKSQVKRIKVQVEKDEKDENEDLVNQLVDALNDFLTEYSEHVNIHNPDVQIKVDKLAIAVISSMSDYEEDIDDDFMVSMGNMDEYGCEEDD